MPGIFLLGYNIGTGSVTAMAKAGSTYGMSLLWTVLLSCMVTYFLIVTYGRFTLITGETALNAFKKHIHPGVAIYFLIAMATCVCASTIGVMGIIADICYEWSKTIVDGGIKPVYFALFILALTYGLFWNGKTRFFQKALALIVAIMAASFIVNFFLLMPPPVEILKGMIPSIPDVASEQGKGPFLVIGSMVGTTVFSGLFIIRTTLVKEAGWTLKDAPKQQRDALVSALMMFVISGTIMAAGAATLYAKGIGLSRASQMVELLEPLAGPFAVTLFVAGVVAAGVSSLLPNILLLPWLFCDYCDSERNMKLPQYRLLAFAVSALGLAVPLFNAPPLLVMIASQVFSAIILPVTIVCILYLGNKKKIVGEHTNSFTTNAILVLILCFAVYMSGIGILGLLGAISNY